MQNHNISRLPGNSQSKYIRNKWFIYTKYQRALPIFCLILQNAGKIFLTEKFYSLKITQAACIIRVSYHLSYPQVWQTVRKKGGIDMEVNSMANIALAQMPSMSTSVPSDISVALLSKQLDLSQEMGDSMIQAMELSVNPNVGGNIDVYA